MQLKEWIVFGTLRNSQERLGDFQVFFGRDLDVGLGTLHTINRCSRFFDDLRVVRRCTF